MTTKHLSGVALAAMLFAAAACSPAAETPTETPEATPAPVETSAAPASTGGLDVVSPESVGFDSAKLQALDAQYAAMVADGKLAGITWLVSRHGKVALQETHGVLNYETEAPMQPDSIFRIASMTKPIAGVAKLNTLRGQIINLLQ